MLFGADVKALTVTPDCTESDGSSVPIQTVSVWSHRRSAWALIRPHSDTSAERRSCSRASNTSLAPSAPPDPQESVSSSVPETPGPCDGAAAASPHLPHLFSAGHLSAACLTLDAHTEERQQRWWMLILAATLLFWFPVLCDCECEQVLVCVPAFACESGCGWCLLLWVIKTSVLWRSFIFWAPRGLLGYQQTAHQLCTLSDCSNTNGLCWALLRAL